MSSAWLMVEAQVTLTNYMSEGVGTYLVCTHLYLELFGHKGKESEGRVWLGQKKIYGRFWVPCHLTIPLENV